MNDQSRSSTITPGFSGPRTRLAVEDIKQSLIDNLFRGMGRVPAIATRNNLHTVLSLVDAWTRKFIFQVVRIGMFCSDCSSGEYCEQIWIMKPVNEEMGR